jgi:HD-like signal output (HDOD) protein
MLHKVSRAFQERSAECEVKPEHVAELGPLQELLSALNDPYASTRLISELVSRLPVLEARCIRDAAVRRPKGQITNLSQALSVLGNRGLEGTLLGLLEDLTILKSDMDAGT